MQDTVAADRLTIIKDGQAILRNLSFSIAPGKITGLIGPSGSGKTTLMRAIVGVQEIAHGNLQLLGLPAGAAALRFQIGYVTQTPAIYEDLSVLQNLQYFAVILGCNRQAVSAVMTRVELRPQRDQLVRTLSGGQRARVSLAIALLGDAKLLVLDEPTVGLDPLLRKKLWALFAELARTGVTLLVSSHVMDEAELCDDILLLRDGRVLSHGPRRALLERTHAQSVQAAFMALIEGAP